MPSVSSSAMSTTRPREEAGDRARRRSADERDGHERHEEDVRRRRRARRRPRTPRSGATAATKTMTPTLSRVDHRRLARGRGLRLLDEHEHGVERGEVDEGFDLDPLVDVRVELPDARDDADGDPARIDRREPPGSPARRDDDVAGPRRRPPSRRGRGRALRRRRCRGGRCPRRSSSGRGRRRRSSRR